MAACLTGFLLSGKYLWESAVAASDFTARAIALTARTDTRNYGLKFEPLLWQLGDHV